VAEASQENYYVFDEPFFTHGLTRQIVAPGPEISGGVVVRGPFYGFHEYIVNNIQRPHDKIVVTRTTAAGTAVGNWVVEESKGGQGLGNMRHFATHPTGYYYLDFPTIESVNNFTMRVSNMLTGSDYQVLSVEFSGDYTIGHLFATTDYYNMENYGITVPFPDRPTTRIYRAVADFQAVINAPEGEVYWQDKTNNKVWFKVKGGVNPGHPEYAADDDLNLYKDFKVRAYGTYTSSNPAYTVSFTVKDGGGMLLPDATVEFRGNKVVSDASGVATFTNVPPGNNLLYVATKNGHYNATGTLNVVAGNIAQIVVLSATSSPAYTVTFTVKDGSGTLQSGISVSFNGWSEITKLDGLAIFRNVAPGTNLPYSASKTSVGHASGSVSVSDNLESTIVLGTALSVAPTPEHEIAFNKIYPNPTKDIITIEYYAQNNESLNFIISDALGRELTNINANSIVGQNMQNLNLATFPNGVYFVTIKNENDLKIIRKIIKN
jgi:hypothetical protein